MNHPISLSGADLRTYDTIFHKSPSHSLEWKSIRDLFENLGHAEQQPDGSLKVTRNGQILNLRRKRTNDVADLEEIITLRQFLEQSETSPLETNGRDPHWLLVIDHHDARIFRLEVNGGTPREILPYNPDVYFRHAHSSTNVIKGETQPEPKSFFEPVAKALKGNGQILIFGVGKKRSVEMNQFVGWIEIHHPDLFKRVIGTHVIDEPHLSEGQLLAKGHEFYATEPTVPA